MKAMRELALLSLAFLCMPMAAQDKVEATVQADLVSKYLWRGQELGHISIQPKASVSWKGLSLTALGNVGFDKEDTEEFNLQLNYTLKGFNIGVIDYWNDEYDKRFFYFKKDGTGHAFEGYADYDFGPVSVSWQTFFAGNDYQEADGKRAWSSYFQLLAPFRLATFDWEAAVGLVPWASDYYSASGFSVTNLSLRAAKDIKITDSFSLPLFGQLVANPASQDFFFVAGFTLNAF